MALILSAPASGKTTYIRTSASKQLFLDGDDIIRLVEGPDWADPVTWSDSQQELHMRSFCERAIAEKKICLGFSKVNDNFSFGTTLTVVVEIDVQHYKDQVEKRHQNMRAGCKPRPWGDYEDQRRHLCDLAERRKLRMFSNFEKAVQFCRFMMEFAVEDHADIDSMHDHLEQYGFVIVPKLISSQHICDLNAIHELLVGSGIKQSDHLYTHPQAPENVQHLSLTIQQFLNPHELEGPLCTLPVARTLLPFFDELLQIPTGQHAFLFNDTILTKTPMHKTRLHWHQDFSFWPLDCPNGILVLWSSLV
jgi:hypothetical protein